MKARTTKIEEFRYPHASIVSAASKIADSYHQALIEQRLANRLTRKELSDRFNLRPRPLQRLFVKACGEICKYLDSKNGRGLFPGCHKADGRAKPQKILQ